MNLDDLNMIKGLDKQNMLAQVNDLPRQLSSAWDLGMSLTLPAMQGVQRVLVAGMGGSAIGADLVAAYAAPRCSVPVIVHRDYDLPGWATGPETLVIASSHSGNTEEVLSAYAAAQSRRCQSLAITTGGRLAEAAHERDLPIWLFQHTQQPRAAVGLSFALLLAALYRLVLLPDPTEDIQETLHALRNQQTNLMPETPVAHNPAKRMAGQLMGRVVVVFGADFMAPVARRWKGQLNENAKTWAQFESLPEADHNTLAGLDNPEGTLSSIIALFLLAPDAHPRNQLRQDLTRQIFMTQGINTDTYLARGNGAMAQIWTALQFGDYTSCYLAFAYGEDPTPVDALVMLKKALDSAT